MPRITLNSGAYSAASLIASAQRSINVYPEMNPEEVSPSVPVTHYPRPGLTPLGAPTTPGQGRGLFTLTNGDLFAVIDQKLLYIDPDWAFHDVGSLVTIGTNPVSMADNGTDAVLVDGTPTGGYTFHLTNRSSFSQIGDPSFLGADRADFLDYFLTFNQPNSPNWYCTVANSVTFNALYLGTKTAWPDDIVTHIACEREEWILGKYKSEVWFNAGGVPFPFNAQPGVIVEHGCAAKYSVAKQDVNIYWLSQSPEGARMVMRGNQRVAQRISTHAIEAEFLKYPRVDDAIGICYQINGHAFYKLSFPTADKCWVFDEATKQWHEDNWADVNGILRRSRVPFMAYAYGKNVGLDWSTGRLYQVDPSNFSDNGNPLVCIRAFPHLLDSSDDRTTYWRLIADMQVGLGTGQVIAGASPWSAGFSPGFGPLAASGGVGSPAVSLRMSRDRGASWGNKVQQSLGQEGQYYTRPTWNRLGYGNDIVFELSWASPMQTALQGAWIVIEKSEGDE